MDYITPGLVSYRITGGYLERITVMSVEPCGDFFDVTFEADKVFPHQCDGMRTLQTVVSERNRSVDNFRNHMVFAYATAEEAIAALEASVNGEQEKLNYRKAAVDVLRQYGQSAAAWLTTLT
jgi:hypothetical protein